MSDPHHKGDADSCSSIDVKTEWDADSCFSVDVIIPYLWGYQDPTADGLFRHSHPNGQLKSEYEQKSGRTVGERRVWHDNGVLARVIPYVAGRIHGVVRQWDEDGKLLDEYTMSDGSGIADFTSINLAAHSFDGRLFMRIFLNTNSVKQASAWLVEHWPSLVIHAQVVLV